MSALGPAQPLSPAQSLSPAQLRQLHAVADVLIPGTGGMPSLREADPQGIWLERTIAARGDLLDRLRELLADLDADLDAGTAERLRDLFETARDDFEVLATFVAGPYFMAPTVRALIGYPGQARNPVGVEEAIAELEDLLESAMSYRRPERDVDDQDVDDQV